MDDSANRLAGLCARLGLVPAYADGWGRPHAAPADAVQALLGELGVDASTPDSIAAAERALSAADWHERLPPVVAIEAGQPVWSVRLRLPGWARHLRWSVSEEGGSLHTGDVDAATLPCTAQAEVAGEWQRELLLTLSLALPPGYHHFDLEGGAEGELPTLLVCAPRTCYRPPGLQAQGKVWGPAVQLYALRSPRNWGMGDFGDLAAVAHQWAARGAGIVGVNPLHAMFSHNPPHASPYSPSSRRQLNTLCIDVEAVDEFADCEAAQQHVRAPEFQQRLAALRATEQVDYPGVAGAKQEVLKLLWAHFDGRVLQAGPTGAAAGPRAEAFRAFQRERGAPLRIHASFEALQAHFHAADPAVWGWPVWPEAYRDPASAEVQAFIAGHLAEVEYFEYLQWLADGQLARVSERCRAQGLPVGLYLDIAVSVDRAGSDTWGDRWLYANGASVGAPPDEVNPNGQDWGLPPLIPTRLRQSRYGVFRQTLRATMRHAGAVRIDHVMGLMRLFWLPPGRAPADGAYVLYPLEEMVAIVALESERNRCMVIGEDLGTVAGEVRTVMARSELLSYRLLYFERGEGGQFKPPEAYPRNALVAISTHDLATLAGWWSGHDLTVRKALALFPSLEVYEEQVVARAQERLRMLLALDRAGLLPEGVSVEPSGVQPLTQALAEAVMAFVARTPSRVMVVQIEDVLGVTAQANLPGTVDEHPNWRQKLPLSIEQIETDPRFVAMTALLAKLRPAPASAASAQQRSGVIVPRATYRLQLHAGFGFDDAIKVLPYLQRLGISHVYCSPIQRARPGSLHGYDVVAHDQINPELGGAEGFERFSTALKEHELGVLLDMVPNHMGIFGEDNAWWMDVLENGPASAHARYFDIDWQPVNRELTGKVLVPVLGDHYGEVLASGQLQLGFDAGQGSFALRYHEHCFPLDPRSYAGLLNGALEQLGDGEARADLRLLVTAFEHLPGGEGAAAGDDVIALRARDKEMLKKRLARLAGNGGSVGEAVARVVEQINASATHNELHALHESQRYRLAFWRVAADEINYRRFFDINALAALRIEEPAVFEATQGLSLDLAAAGKVDGLRIDHPDGLCDPAQYFERLQRGYVRRAWGASGNAANAVGAPGASDEPAAGHALYVVAEKIAAPHEDVPTTWAIQGTTGYRFAMVVGGVLVDSHAAEAFDQIWREFSGEQRDFAELAYEGKREVMLQALASELTVLATALLRIARADRRTRDYTFNTLRDALIEVTACLPVYRTYIVDQPSAQDLRYVDWAVAHARRRSQTADASIFDFVRSCLLNQPSPSEDPAHPERVQRFAARFQQFSAPVTAKGVEDTAFYRYSRLASLNEVGGDPAVFGITPRAFHGASGDRALRWPHTMLATSTHDNKRSEDVRNRLHVLSEAPGRWQAGLQRWHGLLRGRAGSSGGAGNGAADHPGPSAADEYLLYQTLLGTLPAGGLDETSLPAYRERIEAYSVKAAREAKRCTRWTQPDAAYENALLGLVRSALERVQPNPLLRDLQDEAETLAWFGALNTLSTVLLKYTSPGVPDLYQGNELIDLSLVDPDNRRPVDYALRDGLLAALASLATRRDPGVALQALAAAPHDGRAKLWLTWRLLALRARQPLLFSEGDYSALAVRGSRCEHVVAYSRQHGEQRLIVIAGRLFAQLMAHGPGRLPLGESCWGDTFVELPDLPDGTRLDNVLTGETHSSTGGRIRLAQAFAHWPGAAFVVVGPAAPATTQAAS